MKLTAYIQGVTSALKGKPKNQVNLVGAPSFSEVNPYGLYKTYKADEYGSTYPNIRPIVNDLMGILPHAVDKNAKRIEDVAALNALYHPNRTDSRELFMEKLSVSVLCLNYTYLLVWRNEGGVARPGGDFGFKGKNIAGYTFLENPGIEYRDGRVYYKIGAQEFNDLEVIAIPGGAKPGDLYSGYSPSASAAKWATIDGYIADFEKGFFENNAIPAGMFKVTAASTKDFNDTVDKLEERHRGAGNNNNVTYSHVAIDPSTGKEASTKLEWVPFQQSQKDIDFDPILTHTDKRLGEAYGVSSIIKGDDSSAKYSNAEVSEANFAKRAVKPVANRIYSQITHELNRITGGLGYAITFDYEIPAISDAELVKEETRKVYDERVQSWLDKGYSLSSIKQYFKTGDLEKLELSEVAVTEEDNPEVDEGDEVTSAPDRTEIDGITPVNKVKMLSESELEEYEQSMGSIVTRVVDRQFNKAVQKHAQDSISQDDEDDLAALIAIAITIIKNSGSRTYQDLRNEALGLGIDIQALTTFDLTNDEVQTEQDRLRSVLSDFNDDTASNIEKASDGLVGTAAIAAILAARSAQDYRIDRLVKNESWVANVKGGQYANDKVVTSLNSGGVVVRGLKRWRVEPNACPICLPMAGEVVETHQDFSGGVSYPPVHVTCRCSIDNYLEKVFVQDSIEREIHCAKCDRFLGMTTKSNYEDKLKCPCKALEVPVLKEISDG